MCFYKQRRELKGEASPSSPVTPVKVPDCPVPAWLLEELLRPPPAVSKEPLRNLNSCLQQLKYVLALCHCFQSMCLTWGRLSVASNVCPAKAERVSVKWGPLAPMGR